MDQNLQVISKRILKMVNIAYYMLRKGISKTKLMADLTNLMTKRRKITGKAIKNLMSHHHDSGAAPPFRQNHHLHGGADHYEFSCRNSPAFPSFHYFINKRRHFFACAHAPHTLDDDVAAVHAFKAVLEVLNNDVAVDVASPVPPGFGRSSMVVRQLSLRVTDSPFPVAGDGGGEECHVDKAAEEFINRFYKELRRQKTTE